MSAPVRKSNFNTQSKRGDCSSPKASSYLNMHLLDWVRQMRWIGTMSNEKVVTWLNFSTTSPYFCEPLSVQHIEIKMNVPNVWGRQTNTFDFPHNVWKEPYLQCEWWAPWKDKRFTQHALIFSPYWPHTSQYARSLPVVRCWWAFLSLLSEIMWHV